MSERNRGRVHLNERRHLRSTSLPGSSYSDFEPGYEIPDAPENPEFAFLFTPEQQAKIETRFLNGIATREHRDLIAEARAREASLACHARFHKPRRPKRKELRAKLGDIAHRPGSR